ncbi:ankyrin repeat-containing protein-like [Dorcoceras hygrometricum]|uniref:Ankyrin repeat-containing protein-like n=1 Tax=Dorcoceras hygrometricum TaxID=472368 RepID=A0A2Z7AZQ1_9LAMI|nr:ankyrin repeat-containing protein-like [Dorcoceras hygrometricum]
MTINIWRLDLLTTHRSTNAFCSMNRIVVHSYLQWKLLFCLKQSAGKDYTKYLPLRRGITRADWPRAQNLMDTDEEAKTAIISEINETALLIAVTIGKKSNDFVTGLLDSMPDDALAIKNTYGTALHREYLPVHIAAIYCQKTMLKYLIDTHERHAAETPPDGQISIYQRHFDRSPFVGQLGASLLLGVIISQYIDVALNLVKNHSNLAKLKNQSGTDALYELARLNTVFESGAKFTWWQRWIYSPLLLAAHNGIIEVVEVIMEMFPTATNIAATKNAGNIFHVAARQRSGKVFNLLHQMKEGKHFFYNSIDSSGNNYMHLCGEQAPAHKLNLVSGAALQMQLEIQWFKEMENFVTPSRRTSLNNDGKTPYMLFTEKHQELKAQGEKWMKDTATSCTIAAALIATVVFAAAFTVPGGVNNDNGIPIFVNNSWFITFAISDSISLFASATSLLMFLSILTSRYAEEDFLYVLPTRLCIGLLTLFTSMIFMMIAFSSAIYITLRHKYTLFLIPMVVLAFFPVASFVFSQFPLLIDAMYSTYGPGIFGRKRARALY